MTPERQRKRVYDYVVARLRREVKGAKRGTQAEICREIGISSAHMSNVVGDNPTRKIGEVVRGKLARRWGMSPAQLQAIALGEAVSGIRPEVPDPPFSTLMSQIAGLPGLHAVLFSSNSEWRVSTVVRAISAAWDSPDGAPRDGWATVLDVIESGEIDNISGGAEDADRAAKKQAGRRVRLPKKPPHTP